MLSVVRTFEIFAARRHFDVIDDDRARVLTVLPTQKGDSDEIGEGYEQHHGEEEECNGGTLPRAPRRQRLAQITSGVREVTGCQWPSDGVPRLSAS